MWRSGAAAWIVGTLAAPGTQGCQWPQEQERALLGFFLASGNSAPVRIKRSLCKFFINFDRGSLYPVPLSMVLSTRPPSVSKAPSMGL